jgi:hypothetical protein
VPKKIVKPVLVPVALLTSGRQTVRVLYDDGSEGKVPSDSTIISLPKLNPKEAEEVRRSFVKAKVDAAIMGRGYLLEV